MDRGELRRSIRPANFWTKLVFGTLFVAVGVGAAAGGLRTTGGTSFEILGLVLGFLLVVLGAVVIQLALPLKLGGVSISVDPKPVERGCALQVSIEGRLSEKHEAGLVSTRVAKNEWSYASETAAWSWEKREIVHEEWRAVPAASPATLTFEVADRAPSFVTKGVRIGWSVVVRSGSGALSRRTVRPVEVVKRGSRG